MDLDPTYHPTAREQLLQDLRRGILASQREQEQIARRRRIARRHRRNQWLKKHEHVIALAIATAMLIIGVLDWERWLG